MKDFKNLILRCLRETNAFELQAAFDEFTEQDWDAWLETTNEMGLAIIINSRMRRMGVNFPAPVQARLQASLHTNSANNLGILSALHKLAAVFEAAGLPFILLKGVFLAEKLYGNFGERLITDLDILTRLQDLPAALRLVEGLGYRAERPFDPQYELQVSQHLPPYHLTDMPVLEMHLTLLDPMPHFHIDMDGIWQRALRTKVAGREVLVLCDEDLLLHLCTHAAYNHLFDNELRLLYDIKLLLEKYGGSLDWQVLTRRAREWGVQNAVYLALRLTDELIGCPVPASAWQALQPANFDERLIQISQGRVFSKQMLAGGLVFVWSEKGLINRVKASVLRVFLPPKTLASKYNLPPNSKRVFLYYPLRFFNLLMKHTGSLLALQTNRGQKAQIISQETELFTFLDYKQNR